MKSKHDDILEIYIKKLKYFNYSGRTIEIYSHYCKKFLVFTDKYYQHLTGDDFQSYLNSYEFSSVSQQNQIISSIKFLYDRILKRKYNKIEFKRPRKEKKLPKVIDKEFLISKINSINNLKHKSIIQLAFSTGIRVSEVINLKIEDIDSDRMILRINNAKGKKDRIAPLSEGTLLLLRKYYKKYLPKIYLFNGYLGGKYSASSCNKLVKKYIGNEYHFHLLRHSAFTSMLEAGTDLRVIQAIAGHESSKTTEIYTHVSKTLINQVITPM